MIGIVIWSELIVKSKQHSKATQLLNWRDVQKMVNTCWASWNREFKLLATIIFQSRRFSSRNVYTGSIHRSTKLVQYKWTDLTESRTVWSIFVTHRSYFLCIALHVQSILKWVDLRVVWKKCTRKASFEFKCVLRVLKNLTIGNFLQTTQDDWCDSQKLTNFEDEHVATWWFGSVKCICYMIQHQGQLANQLHKRSHQSIFRCCVR